MGNWEGDNLTPFGSWARYTIHGGPWIPQIKGPSAWVGRMVKVLARLHTSDALGELCRNPGAVQDFGVAILGAGKSSLVFPLDTLNRIAEALDESNGH